MSSKEKTLEYTLFFATWNNKVGVEVLDFCPESSTLDLKSQIT